MLDRLDETRSGTVWLAAAQTEQLMTEALKSCVLQEMEATILRTLLTRVAELNSITLSAFDELENGDELLNQVA